MEDYVQRGYLPEALVNFVALLGWSPREEGKEIMRMEELVEEVGDVCDLYLLACFLSFREFWSNFRAACHVLSHILLYHTYP